MLIEQNIADYLSLQPYEYVSTETAEDGRRIQLNLASRNETDEVMCPFCNSHVHIGGSYGKAKASALRKIFDVHAGLSVCHAMKEEMVKLFGLRDEDETKKDWKTGSEVQRRATSLPLSDSQS